MPHQMPQLEQINLLQTSSQGRLTALRCAQELNDLSAAKKATGMRENDSFESRRSAHDLNRARRQEVSRLPRDCNGLRDPMRDQQHSSSFVFKDNLDEKARKKL
jgi:hypothetical protein